MVAAASRRAVLSIAACALLLPLAGCGYSLAGRGSFLPDYIRTIGVPMFTNNTPVFDVERRVTERVVSEFIGRGKYRVLPERGNADALLLGEISSIVVTPAAFNARQQASRYALVVTARIEFRDLKTDKVLWSNLAMQFREEFEPTTATDALDPAAFFGQDVNALDRISQEFARAIVSAILEAF
jgi:hypothetical protein